MAENDSASLLGHWIHSHEEDHAGRKVFRRAGYAFPKARGRAGFELELNRVWVDRPIAAGDGNSRVNGKWELTESDKLCLQAPGKKGAARTLRLLQVEPDRLVVEEMP